MASADTTIASKIAAGNGTLPGVGWSNLDRQNVMAATDKRDRKT
jgi:hypothetical protein